MLCQQCTKNKHYLFLRITFFAESAGSKRILFKLKLFAQNVGLLKRIFFTIPFDKQRRNLLQKKYNVYATRKSLSLQIQILFVM